MPAMTPSQPLSSRGASPLSRLALLAVGAVVAFASLASNASAAQQPVDLGTADSFAALAGSTVTNAGFSTLNGDLGVSPGTAFTGFPPGRVNGTKHSADPVAAQAQADLTAAYNDAAGRTPPIALPADVGGRTLTPGVYKADPALGLTGTLTLDGRGDPNAVFVFQVGSALTTAVSSRVKLTNGAQASNVYWQIGSSATLGTSSVFAGTIMALSSISMNDGVTLNGRALARNGAVTLINDTITVPSATASLDGPNVVRYEVDLPFITSTDELIQGTSVSDGGCEFSGTTTASADRPSVGGEEVAYDPDTCRMVMRTGTLPLDDPSVASASIKGKRRPPKRPRRRSLPVHAAYPYDSDSDSRALGAKSGHSDDYAPRRFSATGYFAWEDPAQLDVNKVSATVNWRPSRGCAAAGSSTVSFRTSWFEATGWRTYSGYDPWEYTALCDRVVSKATGLFYNRPFCNPSKQTDTYISPYRVAGDNGLSGVATQRWLVSKGGDCASLLHGEHRLTVRGV